jgi:hypothetical protein
MLRSVIEIPPNDIMCSKEQKRTRNFPWNRMSSQQKLLSSFIADEMNATCKQRRHKKEKYLLTA